jgi:hypothetical protein
MAPPGTAKKEAVRPTPKPSKTALSAAGKPAWKERKQITREVETVVGAVLRIHDTKKLNESHASIKANLDDSVAKRAEATCEAWVRVRVSLESWVR